jgi:hypothetical protein
MNGMNPLKGCLNAADSPMLGVGTGQEAPVTAQRIGIMLVHSVFFWLHADRTPQQRDDFRQGLESLNAIENVRALYIGTPAHTTPRPVIDRSFSFMLTVVFDDVAGHDAYQVHPVHKEFLARFSAFWSRVQIYDAE